MSASRRTQRRSSVRFSFRFAMILFLPALLLFTPEKKAMAEQGDDSCIECHGKESLLVTNKKLYEYFQEWSSSIHQQEGVTCIDCHGGNPKVSEKDAAHGESLKGSKSTSAVNFRNISKTCGECHEDIYRGFRESTHHEHVVAKKQEEQGPTCVTCHGSINVAVLNVNTIEATCSRCHDEEHENSPEIPGEARDLLNRFLSIHRYYRYIGVRLDSPTAQDYFKQVDAQLYDLSVTWHTFDLDEISAKTESILSSVKAKREEVGKAYRDKKKGAR